MRRQWFQNVLARMYFVFCTVDISQDGGFEVGNRAGSHHSESRTRRSSSAEPQSLTRQMVLRSQIFSVLRWYSTLSGGSRSLLFSILRWFSGPLL